MFIKVWCEYDIGGNFGGNNNEDVFIVDNNLRSAGIERIVVNKLMDITGDERGALDGLYRWEVITPQVLVLKEDF